MRLLDRLLAGEFNPGTANKARVAELLNSAQLVVADNVASYWMTYRNEDRPSASDFPNVMLPFNPTFVEFRFPYSTDTERNVGAHTEAGGLLLTIREKPETPLHSPAPQSWLYGPQVKYQIVGHSFLQPRGRPPILTTKVGLSVDSMGAIVPNPESGGSDYTVEGCIHINVPGKSQAQAHVEAAAPSMYPALLALSFMHCKNVKMLRENPPLPLSRKHEKKTGRPLIRYHVLQIDHMKRILEREGRAGTDGLKKALHFCRGHFVTYGAEGHGLLFGKHSGRFFIPMHSRGSADQGVVVKDYDVK